MPAPQEPNETDSLSMSGESRSRHSSIRGPYREAKADTTTTFPLYCVANSLSSAAQTYSHSLLPLRHGFAFYAPRGVRSRAKNYTGVGASLGDVGLIDGDGAFEYFLNIFRTVAPGTIDQNLPPDFLKDFPAPPLTRDEFTITEKYFPDGTILASNDVNVSKISSSPLKIDFETSAHHGAVLILPEGATREELVDPSRIHTFVKEHAVPWYQYWNGSVNRRSVLSAPNCTLYVVTGIDRASCWATAVFPVPDEHRTNRPVTFKYIEGKEKTPWQRDNQFIVQYRTEKRIDGTFGAVFLRLMAVALSPKLWSQSVAYVPPDIVSHYRILSTPAFGLQANFRNILKWSKRSKNKASSSSAKCPFYPSTSMLHVMLYLHPSATVGILEDSTWFPELSPHILTHFEFLELMIRFFSNFDVVNTNGIVTLVKKDKNEDVRADRRIWVHSLASRLSGWLQGRRDGTQDAETIQTIYKILGIYQPLLRVT